LRRFRRRRCSDVATRVGALDPLNRSSLVRFAPPDAGVATVKRAFRPLRPRRRGARLRSAAPRSAPSGRPRG